MTRTTERTGKRTRVRITLVRDVPMYASEIDTPAHLTAAAERAIFQGPNYPEYTTIKSIDVGEEEA